MSIKDRLARKTQDLVLPLKTDSTVGINPMRTGPGQMLMVNSLMKESNEKISVLEERLKKFDGAVPVVLLEPSQVVSSRWANRVSHSFDSAAYKQLKVDIAGAEGNIQPIKVRPLAGEVDRFEIVFGHRRHRACAELKLPVLAIVEDLSDAELFTQMDRENRSRADLSPWEQGTMYKQALDDKLFGSREQLARALGIDAGNLSKALRLADLDLSVIKAFSSPLDLQYRWAKPLADALLHGRDRVFQVVKELEGDKAKRLSAKQVFDRLTGVAIQESRIEQVRVAKKVVAEFHFNGSQITLKFGDGLIDGDAVARLKQFIANGLYPI